MEIGTMRLIRRLIRGTCVALAIIMAAAVGRASYCSFPEDGQQSPDLVEILRSYTR